MEPEALNRVEERAVFGKLENTNPVGPDRQRRLNGMAVVVGGIVHDQDEHPLGRLRHQVFDESHEAFTVLVRSGGVTDLTAVPVVAAKHVQSQRTARRWNARPQAFAHPATAQRRMQAYGRFVHKDELGFGNG